MGVQSHLRCSLVYLVYHMCQVPTPGLVTGYLLPSVARRLATVSAAFHPYLGTWADGLA